MSADAQAQFGEYPERSVYDLPKDFSDEGYKRVPPVMAPIAAQSGHCKLEVLVGEDGGAEKVDIKSCTDNVFEQETLMSAKRWQFRKDLAGKTIPQDMTFRLTDENGDIIPGAEPAEINADDLPEGAKDAEVLHIMYPPQYPWPQMGTKEGYCCVDFSVSQLGKPFNVNVRGCTNPKFELTAEEAVRFRTYKPATYVGKNVSISGHQTAIDFIKLRKEYEIPSDIYGLIPTPNLNDTELGVCRPNS